MLICRKFTRHFVTCSLLVTMPISNAVMGETMACTQPSNLRLVDDLQIGDTIDMVVAKLETEKIDYLIFSKEQRIYFSIITERGYENLQPISILVRSEDEASKNKVVSMAEILKLTFDGQRHLSTKTCQKIYTGP